MRIYVIIKSYIEEGDYIQNNKYYLNKEKAEKIANELNDKEKNSYGTFYYVDELENGEEE